MRMETKKGTQVLEAFASSLMAGTKDWHKLIADDVTFNGPVDKYKGKKAFIEKNELFMPMVRGVSPHRRFEENGLVVTEATYQLAAPSGKVIDLKTVELCLTREGKIQAIDLYYDAEEFRKEFGIKAY